MHNGYPTAGELVTHLTNITNRIVHRCGVSLIVYHVIHRPVSVQVHAERCHETSLQILWTNNTRLHLHGMIPEEGVHPDTPCSNGTSRPDSQSVPLAFSRTPGTISEYLPVVSIVMKGFSAMRGAASTRVMGHLSVLEQWLTGSFPSSPTSTIFQ